MKSVDLQRLRKIMKHKTLRLAKMRLFIQFIQFQRNQLHCLDILSILLAPDNDKNARTHAFFLLCFSFFPFVVLERMFNQ